MIWVQEEISPELTRRHFKLGCIYTSEEREVDHYHFTGNVSAPVQTPAYPGNILNFEHACAFTVTHVWCTPQKTSKSRLRMAQRKAACRLVASLLLPALEIYSGCMHVWLLSS